KLTYASYGVWEYHRPGANGVADHHYFYFGMATAAAGLPRTGTANYNGMAEGILYEPGHVFDLAGDASLNANFASGEILARMTLTGIERTSAAKIDLGTFQGSGAIDVGTTAF